MRGTELFPSRYMNAGDLAGRSVVVTIRDLKMQTVGADRRAVLYFEGKSKGLVLNKTNWTAIATITGAEDSDQWSGRPIRLVVAMVDFQGRRVPAIRIEAADRRPPAAAPEPARAEYDDSEIPTPDDRDIGF